MKTTDSVLKMLVNAAILSNVSIIASVNDTSKFLSAQIDSTTSQNYEDTEIFWVEANE